MAHRNILDTHAPVWYLEGNPRLGGNARASMDDPESALVLPAIALAEATYVVERRRTTIPSAQDLVARVRADPRIEVYPLTWDVIEQSLHASTIPELHDRLIVATALHFQRMGFTVSLLARDAAITAARLVPIVW